ncbi:MAG: hypothetical protein K6F17_06630 [Lachnospiraceae bacterium]|nr:hypothetical protein [Lachnospiraceae bacterium]
MKKIIYLAILVVIGVCIYSAVKAGSKKKTDSDYKKLETVKAALEELASSSAVKTVSSDQGQWYVFDLRAAKEHDEEFYVKLVEKLGKDFDSKLSNGDYIFVGVFPLRGSYRIYAGDPADSDSMIYPEWKYKKLEKKDL